MARLRMVSCRIGPCMAAAGRMGSERTMGFADGGGCGSAERRFTAFAPFRKATG